MDEHASAWVYDGGATKELRTAVAILFILILKDVQLIGKWWAQAKRDNDILILHYIVAV